MAKGTCSITDCGREHYARTFCELHYARWKSRGDPLFGGAVNLSLSRKRLGPRVCEALGCDRDRGRRKQFCDLHYQRFRKTGDPLGIVVRQVPQNRSQQRGCDVPECPFGHHAHGFCCVHAHRFARHGDPLGGGRREFRGPAIERFASFVDLNPPCWCWNGALSESGYGYFGLNGETVIAHRWSYQYFVGEIPEGLHLDHLCRVTRCVNPYHLEAVTMQENVFRGMLARRVAMAGHQWSIPLLREMLAAIDTACAHGLGECDDNEAAA